MKLNNLLMAVTAALALANHAGAQAIIENLDIRGTGFFGAQPDGFGGFIAHTDNISGESFNGGAFPGAPRFNPAGPVDPTLPEVIDVELTYSNLDIDGDFSANDAVTFTVRWERVDFDADGIDGGFLASFGQGFDTGFGNLNDLQISVVNVSGTTTDSGDTIVFDGFTEAIIGAGGLAGGIDRNVEVNGNLVSITAPDTGAFQFLQDSVAFATPVTTLELDNSGDSDFDGNGDGGVGSIVARAYDLQFSATDVVSLAGDFNNDLTVDAADYVTLRDQDPAPTAAEFTLFVDNFGASLPGVSAPIAIPEPTTLLLLLLGAPLARRRFR